MEDEEEFFMATCFPGDFPNLFYLLMNCFVKYSVFGLSYINKVNVCGYFSWTGLAKNNHKHSLLNSWLLLDLHRGGNNHVVLGS